MGGSSLSTVKKVVCLVESSESTWSSESLEQGCVAPDCVVVEESCIVSGVGGPESEVSSSICCSCCRS